MIEQQLGSGISGNVLINQVIEVYSIEDKFTTNGKNLFLRAGIVDDEIELYPFANTSFLTIDIDESSSTTVSANLLTGMGYNTSRNLIYILEYNTDNVLAFNVDGTSNHNINLNTALTNESDICAGDNYLYVSSSTGFISKYNYSGTRILLSEKLADEINCIAWDNDTGKLWAYNSNNITINDIGWFEVDPITLEKIGVPIKNTIPTISPSHIYIKENRIYLNNSGEIYVFELSTGVFLGECNLLQTPTAIERIGEQVYVIGSDNKIDKYTISEVVGIKYSNQDIGRSLKSDFVRVK